LAQWYTLAIPILGRLRQKDGEFEAALDYMANPVSKKKKKRGKGRKEEKEGRKEGRKEGKNQMNLPVDEKLINIYRI
jgi:hypothetical protein